MCGPIGAMIATLMDIGWNPSKADCWEGLGSEEWKFVDANFCKEACTPVMSLVAGSVKQQLWAVWHMLVLGGDGGKAAVDVIEFIDAAVSH